MGQAAGRVRQQDGSGSRTGQAAGRVRQRDGSGSRTGQAAGNGMGQAAGRLAAGQVRKQDGSGSRTGQAAGWVRQRDGSGSGMGQAAGWVRQRDRSGSNGHAGNTYYYQNSIHAAMAGFDYTSISVSQIFASGSANGTTRCVDIFVQDDEALEGNQTFTLAIATSDSNVVLGTDVTVISIMDDDGNTSSMCILLCIWHLDSEPSHCGSRSTEELVWLEALS